MFEVFKSDWCPLTFYFKGDSFDIIDFNQRIIYFMEYLISVIKDPRKNSSVLLTLVFFFTFKIRTSWIQFEKQTSGTF